MTVLCRNWRSSLKCDVTIKQGKHLFLTQNYSPNEGLALWNICTATEYGGFHMISASLRRHVTWAATWLYGWMPASGASQTISSKNNTSITRLNSRLGPARLRRNTKSTFARKGGPSFAKSRAPNNQLVYVQTRNMIGRKRPSLGDVVGKQQQPNFPMIENCRYFEQIKACKVSPSGRGPSQPRCSTETMKPRLDDLNKTCVATKTVGITTLSLWFLSKTFLGQNIVTPVIFKMLLSWNLYKLSNWV